MIKFNEVDSAFMTEKEVSEAILNEVSLVLASVQLRSIPEQLDYLWNRVESARYRLSEEGVEEAAQKRIDADQADGEFRYRQSVLADEL